MATRRRVLSPIGFALLILVSCFAAPVEGSYQGLSVFVLAESSSIEVGAEVHVTVHVYLWSTLVDPGVLNVSAGVGSIRLNASRESTGVYHASYNIRAADFSVGEVEVIAAAEVGTVHEESADAVPLTAPPWRARLYAVEAPPSGSDFAPGNLAIEVQAYSGTRAAEAPTPSCEIGWQEGAALFYHPTFSAGNVTKLGPGLYRCAGPIPPVGHTSKTIEIRASYGAPVNQSARHRLVLHPFPAALFLSNVTETGATAHVVVGGADPIAGIAVAIVAYASTPLLSPIHNAVVLHNGTTDGFGSVHFPFTYTNMSELTVGADVKRGLDVANLVVDLKHDQLIARPWEPEPVASYDSVRLVTDPSVYRAGDSAHLTFEVYSGGHLLPSTSLAVFLTRRLADDGVLVYNPTTDPEGRFAIDYAIPPEPLQPDIVDLEAILPGGAVAYMRGFSFREPRSASDDAAWEDGNRITVTAQGTQTGRTVKVSVDHRPLGEPHELTGFAFIVPHNATGALALSEATGGTVPYTRLQWTGVSLTGSIQVPPWYPPGAYTVGVYALSVAFPENFSEWVSEYATAVVSIEDGGWRPPSPAGSAFLPGIGPAGILFAPLVAALAWRRRTDS